MNQINPEYRRAPEPHHICKTPFFYLQDSKCAKQRHRRKIGKQCIIVKWNGRIIGQSRQSSRQRKQQKLQHKCPQRAACIQHNILGEAVQTRHPVFFQITAGQVQHCKPSEVISETIQRKLQRTEGFSDAEKEQKRRQQLLHPFLGKGFQPCVEKWGQQAQHHISAHEPVMSGLHRKNTVPDVVGIENLRPRKDTDKCQNRRNQHRIKQRLKQHLRHTPEGKGTGGKKISADQHINVDCDNAD